MNTRGELLLFLRTKIGGMDGPRIQTFIDWIRAHTKDETDTFVPSEEYRIAQRAVVSGRIPGFPVIADQPPPLPTDRRPCWETVIEHTDKRRHASAYGSTGIVDLVIADMRERNRVGTERYGVPLTSGNGRDHMIDVYQEKLDAAVYLVAELDEYDLGPDTYPDASRFDQGIAWKLKLVQRMFHETIDHILRLRALIAGELGAAS